MKKLNIKGKWIKPTILATLISVSAPALAATNGTMMQYFHWYNSQSDNLWTKVSSEAQNLSDVGITALWLPPAYKGQAGAWDVGYGVYDLYDLGEFNQKGTIRTKYGTKDQYLAAVNSAHNAGVNIYADVVLNHMMGADATESVTAVRVDPNNRNQEYWGDINIDAWTEFNFTARNNKYSDFKWRWFHFDGVDWDDNTKENCGGTCVYKFRGTGKAWDTQVASEKGNYDYLMGADLDMDHQDVVNELKNWGRWYADFTGVDGFRVDAVKHIKASFSKDWINTVRAHTGKEMFTVAEYWEYDVNTLKGYLADTEYTMSLFDAPLHMNFHTASKSNGNYDMGSLMNGTLMQSNPMNAVTLVENHDTQPLQALESPVADWFKPLAYSFILLRQEGYPNVFYADYYGATYTDKGGDGNDYTINLKSHKPILDILLKARRDYAYGAQNSYLDNSDVIGFTREGDAEHWKGLAVLMTDNSYEGYKWMKAGDAHKNACFTDITGSYASTDKVCTNNDGWGNFKTKPGSVSVWVKD
ncbi:alpha-amylase [Psychromonas aquimarina]|uniref:alpha-amylase n=1 Tax=Psychromonas aquimarina TaxID=444919 RepID=UPI000420399F|nr:alpha-amylase [Psychromonas aquimarina]